jgi:ATP-dependent RNA helicase DHX29
VGELRPPTTPRTNSTPQTPRTPRSPAQFLASQTPPPPKIPYRLDANAAAFVPSVRSSQSSPYDSSHEGELGPCPAPKLHALQTASPYDSDYELSDPDDPNIEYVRLKMRLTELTSRNQSHTSPPEIQSLRRRLETVKRHYFFVEKDAELQYRAERQKADEILLQSRLRGTAKCPPNPSPPKIARLLLQNLEKSGATSPCPDFFDGDSEDSAGGLLEILEEMPTEISSNGFTTRVRDMALPRHWSGRTPKILLSETVAKTDRYAAISYRIVSGGSRAKRAAVTIRDKEWSMEGVACHDETQAEHYIATVALHALSFPTTEGFAAGLSGSARSQTFFRLLPAVFRDLWNELEVARKVREDGINRSIWARLGAILERKLEANAKVSPRSCFERIRY